MLRPRQGSETNLPPGQRWHGHLTRQRVGHHHRHREVKVKVTHTLLNIGLIGERCTCKINISQLPSLTGPTVKMYPSSLATA